MADILRFEKYQGAGNDFVVLDGFNQPAPLLRPEDVRFVCHRHAGVGADGVLSVLPATVNDARAKAKMRVQNADGSESDMCGNGLRCVAQWLLRRGLISIGESFALQAGETLYDTQALDAHNFCITLGEARLEHADLPKQNTDDSGVMLHAHGRDFLGVGVHFGNPHFVVFVDNESPMHLAQTYGPALEAHSAFPNRANISFANVQDSTINAVVFERGVGITQACGSGACAIGVAAYLRGQRMGASLIANSSGFHVALPGGVLVISVDKNLKTTLQGEARYVFAGEVSVP